MEGKVRMGGWMRVKRRGLGWAAVLTLAVLLLMGCGGKVKQEVEQGAHSLQGAIDEAALAVEALRGAVEQGDRTAIKAAYERFSEQFGEVLAPVSMEDPTIAQQMANANSAIKEMLAGGKLDTQALERQVEQISEGLQSSVTAMARGGAQVVDVTAVDFRFQPPEIRVKVGTKVTVRLTNKGTQPHEFEIEELDFEIGPIQPGQTAEKSFVASRAGRFAYECHVDGHLQKGMRGLLLVEK